MEVVNAHTEEPGGCKVFSLSHSELATGTLEGREQMGKKCNMALTLTKKGTISMTMASFRSGFSMGFNRATCKEKQTQ